ncbi:MAG: Spy/CpxP family protein refolding chaperone [Hyphomicrobiales bacterium]
MLRTVFASALALAAIGFLPGSTGTARASEPRFQAQGDKLTEVNIGRIKNVLRLTPSQQTYWAPLEAALLSIAREQAQTESDGLFRRISRRVVAIALTSGAVQRIAAAAVPLVRSLDDEQRHAALLLAQEMGLGPVVAALN